MEYTQQQVEKRLALQTALVRLGLEPDYAELQALRVGQAIEERSVPELAAEIFESADERWKKPVEQKTDIGSSFYDQLRKRIEAERATRRRSEPSAAERLGIPRSEQ